MSAAFSLSDRTLSILPSLTRETERDCGSSMQQYHVLTYSRCKPRNPAADSAANTGATHRTNRSKKRESHSTHPTPLSGTQRVTEFVMLKKAARLLLTTPSLGGKDDSGVRLNVE